MHPVIKKVLTIIFLCFALQTIAQDNFLVVIDYQFDEAAPFFNGLAKVGMDDDEYGRSQKWGCIDSAGKVVIDLQFEDASYFTPNGFFIVKKGDRWGYINSKGEVIINFQFDRARDFAENGLARVKQGDKWGYINKAGEVLIDFLFDYAYDFAENDFAVVKKGNKWGYIDRTGGVVINYTYDIAYGFTPNGLGVVKKRNKWGYINSAGEVIIDFQFDDACLFTPKGLARVKKGEKWGYIDKTGKVVINFQFDDSSPFFSNLVRIKKGEKWGYIDSTGEVVINLQFDYACDFAENGFASVKKGGKWGYIDKTGEVLIDFRFDYAYDFAENGLARVEKGGKCGYIDKSGEVLIDFRFDYAYDFAENGLACVKKGEKWGYIKYLFPTEVITEYLNNEIKKWQQKRKYETTDAYKERVNEENRKKKLEELSNIAVRNTAPNYCNWNIISTEYDADNQTFKINVKGLSPFYLKVPLNEAEAFDKSITSLQFQNKEYALGSNDKFFLQKATIRNPYNGKVYNFSSTDKAAFAYTQLNMNFEPLNLNIQSAASTNNVKTETKVVSVGLSDVDVNIPTNPQTNYKTFVVIIANENYSREVKVQFAANDGKVFKEYCEKTLGIPSKNIHFSQDATFGTMKSEIKWISDVAEAYNGQAKIIFYYAGHGMPNESNKSAYLLPVDGFSSDYETAIKLDDFYNRISLNPTQSVTVFLDACFSGSVRDNGMLANARGVKIKPKQDLLKSKMIVFSAATGDETAYPYKEKQHGLFTYFLLKKLQETKGNVNYQTLSNYIIENVQQQSIVVNQKSQTPQVNTSTDIKNTWQMMKIK